MRVGKRKLLGVAQELVPGRSIECWTQTGRVLFGESDGAGVKDVEQLRGLSQLRIPMPRITNNAPATTCRGFERETLETRPSGTRQAKTASKLNCPDQRGLVRMKDQL